MIFPAEVIGSMMNPINVAAPVLAGLFVRHLDSVVVLSLIWATLVHAFAVHAEQGGFVIDHGMLFLARLVAGLIAAVVAWCIALAVRRRL